MIDEDTMLTTLDNPYNPFTQYQEWYVFDTTKGYNTCALLARLTVSSDELSESDEAIAIAEGMNSVIDLNVSGNYIKVTKENFKDKIKLKVYKG